MINYPNEHAYTRLTIVQDPTDAAFPAMPRNAMRYLEVDHCVRLSEIAPTLARLTRTPATREETEMPPDMEERTDAVIREQIVEVESGAGTDRPALVSCPDCGGTIWRFQLGDFTQLQCREGHRYTAGSFFARQGEEIEQTLWTAVRLLEERATLARKFVSHARDHGDPGELARWEREAEESQRRAEVLRQLLA